MFAGGGVLGHPSASNNELDKQTDNLGTQRHRIIVVKMRWTVLAGLVGDMATSGSFSITGALVPNQIIASELLGTFSAIYNPATSSKSFYL